MSCTEVPKVRRLSLPTTRERRYLANIHVQRAKGRAIRYTRSISFSLLVWPLVLSKLHEQDTKPTPSNTKDGDVVISANLLPDDRDPANDAVTDDDGDDVDSDVDDDASNENDDIGYSTGESTDNEAESNSTLTSTTEENPQTAKKIIGLITHSTDHSQTVGDPNAPDYQWSPNQSNSSSVITNMIQPHTQDTAIALESKRHPLIHEIPPWAYITSIRASKVVLGKRAVRRNRAKRRIRAAAAQILPQNARRGMEYQFNAYPESLVVQFPDLLEEVSQALKAINCWEDDITIEMLRREKYRKR